MDEEMQKKYVELQMMQQHIQQMHQQIEQFDTQLVELNNVIEALEDFKSTKKDSPALVPLASGIFAYAEIKETEFVRVNVGSNVSVKKSVQDTVELVKQQIVEIENYKVKLVENFNMMNQQAQMIQQQLMQIAAEKEKKE